VVANNWITCFSFLTYGYCIQASLKIIKVMLLFWVTELLFCNYSKANGKILLETRVMQTFRLATLQYFISMTKKAFLLKRLYAAFSPK